VTIDAIKETVHTEPFHPFGPRLADGKVVKVSQPDYIAFGPKGRTVVVYGADGSFRIPDVTLITALERNGRSAKHQADPFSLRESKRQHSANHP
jgi:hypothetical protein